VITHQNQFLDLLRIAQNWSWCIYNYETHKHLGTHVILVHRKISQIYTIKKSKKFSILVLKWQNVSDIISVVFFHFLVWRRVKLPSMSWIIYMFTCSYQIPPHPPTH
jgi:hypothetical protein